jgi:hypothetical protein
MNEKAWKEAVMTYRTFTWRQTGKPKIPELGKPVFQLKFKPGTSNIQVKRTTA